MKNINLFVTLLCIFAACNSNPSREYASTIKVEETDSPETIIDKAAHVVPTANQLAALQNEYIAFIHFGVNTFTRLEWGDGFEKPETFDLKTLDTDQWCKAMKDAGMTMVIFTAKHHDGFCLWPSRYTDHSIASTNFREGKGDVMKDLAASAHKYGIKLGVYLSPADLFQIENPEGLYGNLSKYTKRTIPRPIEGRPFANKQTFEFVVDDYNEYFLNQLFELLTEYGPVHEVWFDGAHPKRKGGQTYAYREWRELIGKLAPEAVIFGKEDIRWCGNESGNTRETEYNVIAHPMNPDTMTYFADMTDTDLGSRDKLIKANYLHYQQTEVNTSIREGWFYRDDIHQGVRTPDDVFDIYERAVGGNATFLLNIPPNREGKFSERDVETLAEVGKRIKQTYGTDLLADTKLPKELLDNDINTFTEVETNEEITINLTKPTAINRLVIQEAIAKRGERVEEHKLEAMINGEWKEIATATNIGYKRILRFADVTTDRLKLTLTKTRATPGIAKIAAHYYESQPPQLEFNRKADGTTSIIPRLQDFTWKVGDDNASANLNKGYKIYYTTDGTTPSESSTLYAEPFKMEQGILKAFATLNGRKGSITSEQMGYAKGAWKIVSISNSANNSANASATFDNNAGSTWKSADSNQQHITIDLGQTQSISGFAYTPPARSGNLESVDGVVKIAGNSTGLMARGMVETSNDGKTWKKAEDFYFGNLINDPSKRYHHFKDKQNARYVRITATESTGNARFIIVAELDIF